MFNESLRIPEDGKSWPTAWEILEFTEKIRGERTLESKYYTYAQLQGYLKVGSHSPFALFLVADFYGYCARTSTKLSVGLNELESIEKFLLKMNISEQTSFTPNFGLDNEIIELVKQTKMPDIILEYGRYKINTEKSKPYIVLYHTIDMSTHEAFSRIQNSISPYGNLKI